MKKFIWNIFLSLFIWWFFDVPSNIISIRSYKLILWIIILIYILWCIYLIKKIIKWWKKHIVDEWNEDVFVLRKWVRFLLVFLIVFFVLLFIYLIWSWIIQNMATISSNWLAIHLHINWWETPVLEIN